MVADVKHDFLFAHSVSTVLHWCFCVFSVSSKQEDPSRKSGRNKQEQKRKKALTQMWYFMLDALCHTWITLRRFHFERKKTFTFRWLRSQTQSSPFNLQWIQFSANRHTNDFVSLAVRQEDERERNEDKRSLAHRSCRFFFCLLFIRCSEWKMFSIRTMRPSTSIPFIVVVSPSERHANAPFEIVRSSLFRLLDAQQNRKSSECLELKMRSPQRNKITRPKTEREKKLK